MDERRSSPRIDVAHASVIVRLELSDGSRQLGIIEDLSEGGARLEMNGVVSQMQRGDEVQVHCNTERLPEAVRGFPVLGRSRVMWVDGRNVGLQFQD